MKLFTFHYTYPDLSLGIHISEVLYKLKFVITVSPSWLFTFHQSLRLNKEGIAALISQYTCAEVCEADAHNIYSHLLFILWYRIDHADRIRAGTRW